MVGSSPAPLNRKLGVGYNGALTLVGGFCASERGNPRSKMMGKRMASWRLLAAMAALVFAVSIGTGLLLAAGRTTAGRWPHPTTSSRVSRDFDPNPGA